MTEQEYAALPRHERPHLPYEEAAHVVTVTGWACRKCDRWWGPQGEHMARYCCAESMPCKCGGRASKSYTVCQACRGKARDERWAKLYADHAVDWDGEAPLCLWDVDRYFWSAEDVEEYLDAGGGRTLESLRLCLAEPARIRHFEMGDYLCDELPEGFSDHHVFEEIDKQVNDFIAAGPYGDGGPWSWFGSDTPVTLESLRAHVREPEEGGDVPERA